MIAGLTISTALGSTSQICLTISMVSGIVNFFSLNMFYFNVNSYGKEIFSEEWQPC